MSTNIIKAIINLVNNPIRNVSYLTLNKNKINNMGAGLESFITDMFAGLLGETDEQKKNQIKSNLFSYLGNQNNPPDMMIRNGDAIEVKKIGLNGAELALNSSYPKAKLLSNNHMVTKHCRDAEEWKEKDLIYAIGTVQNETIKHLSLIYGEDYAADIEIYEKFSSVISKGISSIEGPSFTKSKELGRVNNVDPLGITNLRIRGMWTIKNPLKIFSYIYSANTKNSFNLMVIINDAKFATLPEQDKNQLQLLVNSISNLNMIDVEIKNPNNPVLMKKAKLITFYIT